MTAYRFTHLISCLFIGMQTSSCVAEYLTVADALEVPSLQRIEKAYQTRGGIYSDAIGRHIQIQIQEILSGGHQMEEDAKCASDENNYFKDQIGKINIPSSRQSHASIPYPQLAQQLLFACQKAYVSIDAQKKEIAQQNDELISDPVLRTAHYFALLTVVQLLFIIFSPRALPSDRMHALYIFNTVQLLGDRGVQLARFRARLNRFYFTYEGVLRSYDPSVESGHTAKHIKSLAEFLNSISTSQKQALLLFSRGMSAGIPLMENCYEQIKRDGWNRSTIKFGWRFAAALFKEITALDVIELRTIEPIRIFSHKANRDLFALMCLCSRAQREPHQKETLFAQAEEICELYKSANKYHYNIMKRYCHNTQEIIRYQIGS